MSLTTSLETARSNLSVLSERTSVVSRNVANSGNDYATRKIASSTTGANGVGVRLTGITRQSDQVLFENAIASNSSSGRYEAVVDALDQLNQTINDVEQDSSPAALVGKLGDALQQFSSAPQDFNRAQTAIFAATDLATALNSATELVQQVRTDADEQIAVSVERLNTLLSQFEQVNLDVINATRLGNDSTDFLDTRDNLLSDISREIGIRTVTRENNDLAIYTDSGVTLFERQPRAVSFQQTAALNPSSSGNAVFIDGVRVTGDTAVLPIGSGRIKGLAEIRDEIAVTYQSQLDEIARGLITAFAESDQSATPTLPDATGLFSYTGSPAVPAAGTIASGLAGQISVNPAVDPAQGGDPFLLRNGGINGAGYVYNTSGAAGFSDRLRQVQDALYAPNSFDPAAQAGSSATLAGFASNSVGWLQDLRQTTGNDFEFQTTLFERATDALSKTTGVNLDFEMTLLLDLERSYQATARLISTIDNMFASLLSATG
jgi:flagellar hook-associated protein 1 FlgK